jgi:gamma-glutamyltranspeptidase/glutathione hydrolase
MRDFQLPGRSPVYATTAMAATSMPAATLTALDVLRAGGTAADAAIAAAAVLAVIEPQSTGIGGDCFCLYWSARDRAVFALNGSGRAPAYASPEYFAARGLSTLPDHSPHAVTIPGAVAAWETLAARFGRKGLDALLAPAIRFAEEGHPVHPRVAYDWQEAAPKLRTTGAEAFLPGGAAPAPGTLFRQPALAATLRAIARHGARAFYEGEIAADLAATLRAHGGEHTEADFAAGLTAPEFVTPLSAPWRGMRIWQCPPNGSGFLVLMLMGILERLPRDPAGPLGADRIHRHAEAARLVYRDRDAFLGDPAFTEVPLARLLDPAYLAALAAAIDDREAAPHLPPPGESALSRHRDTVYLTVADGEGNVCSFINSLFQSFGSGILAFRSGVMLHNRGLGFRLEAGHPNSIAPGKRPLHTIIPGLLTDAEGLPLLGFGVMGGHFQPMGQSLLLSNVFDYGLDLQEALDCPRFFPWGGVLEVERGLPEPLLAALAARGHHPRRAPHPLGGGQAILIDRARGVLIGASDPRKDGLALGF